MRKSSLKAGPLHLAAIVLAHLACMSLMVWLSLWLLPGEITNRRGGSRGDE